MPIDVLRGIHEELQEHLGMIEASQLIYRCGYRSGNSVVKDMNIEFPDKETLSKSLPELWLQMGLGVIDIEKMETDEILLHCQESNEAVAQGNTGKKECDLTCGYLAGMMTTIMDSEFECVEERCVSEGNGGICVYRLTRKHLTQ